MRADDAHNADDAVVAVVVDVKVNVATAKDNVAAASCCRCCCCC